jgi:hypothetical protein
MLLIASLLAAPMSRADSAVCEGVQGHAQAEHIEGAWEPRPEISVRAFGSLRTREVATVRVLGRCVVKAAPENPRPVLFGSFAVQIDDPDDENLAGTKAEAMAPLARSASVGAGPKGMYVLRAPRSQLERPPRA